MLPLYAAFVERFGAFEALAASDAGDVMRAWQGLGINSRAQRLRLLARTVVREHRERCRERDALLALPGIGPYTAAAVRRPSRSTKTVRSTPTFAGSCTGCGSDYEFPARASERAVNAAATALVPAGRGHELELGDDGLGRDDLRVARAKCLLCPLAKDCAAAPIDAPRLAELAKTAARRSPQEALPFVRTTRFLRGRIITIGW